MREMNKLILPVGIAIYFVLAGSGITYSFSQDNSNKSFETFQAELLDVAFKVASAIPVQPHIVDRSKTQEAVIASYLELGQPVEALKVVEDIQNWRRGTAHANVGFYYAQQGEREKAIEQLEIAGKIASTTADWPRDRIRAFVARGYAYLGENEKAASASQNIDVNEASKVNSAAAMVTSEENYKDQLAAAKKMGASDQFDVKQQGVSTALELWNAFYANRAKRKTLEKLVYESWADLGGYLQINYLYRMIDYALLHQDPAKAKELLKKAQKIHDQATWETRYDIPVMARLAELYFRAGDEVMARNIATEAEGMYAENRLDILSIDRAGLLAPLGGAYQTMGDRKEALRIYTLALEEAGANPNARPRAEDISLICRSMALAKVEPNPELWQRIRQLEEALKEPW